MAEDDQSEGPARASPGPGRLRDQLVVLPCIDSMVQASRFPAFGAARELDFLPPALPSTLLFRVQTDGPDAIVIAEGEAFLSRAGNRSALQEVFAGTPTVLLATQATAAIARSAARLNIFSVLPLQVTAHQLVTALSATADGFAVTLPRRPTPSEAIRVREELTAREVEVLRLMARGQTNKQVAARLNISEHTAKFHVSSVLAKLGARTRTEAVTIGMTRGVVAI
ncbi:MAG TPA: response regulator transcription factor [Acidobacteriaceae bacterium]|nr:response regulator transcription factor [Acidobacteriaceae bacterium]